MPHPRTEELVERARVNLLDARYGQFDLIPALIPLPALLQEPPRQVRRLIAARLSVPEERIRYRTFLSWLARFRQRQALLRDTPPAAPPPSTPVRDRPGTAADWRAFQASEPRRQEGEGGTAIAFPRYD